MSDADGGSGWEGMGNTPIYGLREHRFKRWSQREIRKEPSLTTTPVSGWKRPCIKVHDMRRRGRHSEITVSPYASRQEPMSFDLEGDWPRSCRPFGRRRATPQSCALPLCWMLQQHERAAHDPPTP